MLGRWLIFATFLTLSGLPAAAAPIILVGNGGLVNELICGPGGSFYKDGESASGDECKPPEKPHCFFGVYCPAQPEGDPGKFLPTLNDEALKQILNADQYQLEPMLMQR